MHKKMIKALLTLTALGAFAGAPAVAQARHGADDGAAHHHKRHHHHHHHHRADDGPNHR
jgi:Ni/Co efflux regulator RcnB